MSKTFSARPAVSQRGRGRGRAQTTETEPSVRGERVSPSRTASHRGSGASGGPKSLQRGGPVGNRGARGRMDNRGLNRGVGGRGQGIWDQGMDDDLNQDGTAERNDPQAQAGDSVQQRATYAGGYTIISPNEKKRRQVTEQAERETKQYEQYRQQNKPKNFSYVGTAVVLRPVDYKEPSQDETFYMTDEIYMLKDQERRQQQKLVEDKELEQKKMAARKQSELYAQKNKTRQTHLRSDMNRVNQAFLDRFEAQVKTKTALQQPPEQKSQSPSGSGSYPSPSFAPGDQVAQSRFSQSGTRTSSTPNPTHTDRRNQPSSSASTTAQAAVAQPYLEGEGSSSAQGPHDEFYDQLQLMQSMFPQYEESELLSILLQCHGSVEEAVQLLGL